MDQALPSASDVQERIVSVRRLMRDRWEAGTLEYVRATEYLADALSALTFATLTSMNEAVSLDGRSSPTSTWATTRCPMSGSQTWPHLCWLALLPAQIKRVGWPTFARRSRLPTLPAGDG